MLQFPLLTQLQQFVINKGTGGNPTKHRRRPRPQTAANRSRPIAKSMCVYRARQKFRMARREEGGERAPQATNNAAKRNLCPPHPISASHASQTSTPGFQSIGAKTFGNGSKKGQPVGQTNQQRKARNQTWGTAAPRPGVWQFDSKTGKHNSCANFHQRSWPTHPLQLAARTPSDGSSG
jgi:hypothetical protein